MSRERSALDKFMVVVVFIIALVVIALSTHNTAMLARELNLNPFLTAGLVELLFASLLFIRGRQRATQRNVPLFLSIGYFVSLGFVTGVNMYGLYQENPVVGPIVGGAITGAMWLMESTLVWLWTDSHKPHQKNLRDLKREAKREIKRMKLIQKIEWMRSEAQKPNLDLIREARKAEEERKEIVKGGLPGFFKDSGEDSKVDTRQADIRGDNKQADAEVDVQVVRKEDIQEGDEQEKIDLESGKQEVQEEQIQVNTLESVMDKDLEGTSEQEKVENNLPARQKLEDDKKKEDKQKDAPITFEEKRASFDKEMDRVEKIARDIWKEEGKRPGRKKIKDTAMCSDRMSRKVADKLKLEEGEKGVETKVG
ncbi:hypothetical protein [Desmospora activa]|uniref:DUF2637 domain-containing protein n=1 Tax=Desmospora activa DSM 45169 TaxID=1121389 RepID=A0A2T4YZ12_9BACL|nr:hypothetical protein [Desmospora activa]PTM52190.1 hypothetical protein C8J48_3737 [Desmospora activa DSM 45169]